MSGSVAFDRVGYFYAGQPRLLQDFSMRVDPGLVTVLRGPNGCGKTTLLRLAAGLLRPRSGRIHVEGRVAFVSSAVAFHEVLTVEEEIDYLADAGTLDRPRIAAALERWGFDVERLRAEIATLSTGWRHRLALALAESVDADCVLLDEPFANLDSEAADTVRRWVADRAEHAAAILIAHHGELDVLGDAPRVVVDMSIRQEMALAAVTRP